MGPKDSGIYYEVEPANGFVIVVLIIFLLFFVHLFVFCFFFFLRYEVNRVSVIRVRRENRGSAAR